MHEVTAQARAFSRKLFGALLFGAVSVMLAALNFGLHAVTLLCMATDKLRSFTKKHGISRTVLLAAGGLLFGTLVLALVSLTYTLALVTVAKVIAWAAAQDSVRTLVAFLPGDDIHSLLALNMVGDVYSPKIALDTIGGDLLAKVVPDFFTQPSEFYGGNWLSVIFGLQSSAVGMHMASLTTGALFVILGFIMTILSAASHAPHRFRGFALPPVALFTVGILWQAAGAAAVLQLSWADNSGGEIVLNLVSTKVLGLDGAAHDMLISPSEPLLTPLLNCAILLSIYAFVLGTKRGVQRLTGIRISTPPEQAYPRLTRPFFFTNLVPGPLSLVVGLLLLQPHMDVMPPPPPQPMAQSAVESIAETASVALIQNKKINRGPSTVNIVPVASRFEYYVNGTKKRIRGVGYNAITKGMSIEDRRQLYAQDFPMMQSAGINTILGWDPAEFDEALLDVANENDLGVIVPFELNRTMKFEDPAVRARLLEDIAAWVQRYRAFPALRMWGLGNEVIHGIGDVKSARAIAFGGFLVSAADMVHQLDPDHPVIYRGAEDAYLDPIAKALKDGKTRPWFVYGMNFFSNRISQALANGPTSQFSQPLMLSEFGPAGVNPPFRASGYAKQWDSIQSFTQKVIGGSAYVWSTVGPEPLDRNFGLTDGKGTPIDDSLATLASAFLSERSLEQRIQAAANGSAGSE